MSWRLIQEFKKKVEFSRILSSWSLLILNYNAFTEENHDLYIYIRSQVENVGHCTIILKNNFHNKTSDGQEDWISSEVEYQQVYQ